MLLGDRLHMAAGTRRKYPQEEGERKKVGESMAKGVDFEGAISNHVLNG